MTALLDDHLLRDWMAGSDPALSHAVGGEAVATTNLFYARLCKSAARNASGALLGHFYGEDRQTVVGALVRLPKEIAVVPMRGLAWRMGTLMSEHSGLSTLGSEAVAAAETLDARILASARNDSPGIRGCCERLGIAYETVAR